MIPAELRTEIDKPATGEALVPAVTMLIICSIVPVLGWIAAYLLMRHTMAVQADNRAKLEERAGAAEGKAAAAEERLAWLTAPMSVR